MSRLFFFIGLVPAFGAFASRVNRLKLLTWVTVFFVANILVFFVLGRTGAHLGVVFFIWVGIFNVMAISQFWAFANDIYTPEQGKRLLAVVGIGSSLGAWAGSAVREPVRADGGTLCPHARRRGRASPLRRRHLDRERPRRRGELPPTRPPKPRSRWARKAVSRRPQGPLL